MPADSRSRHPGSRLGRLGRLACLAVIAAPLAAAPAYSPALAASAHHDSVPSKPDITTATGGTHAHLVFRVASDGGQHWDKIDARGEQWKSGKVVGHCHAPVLASGGTDIDYNPAGPGRWSFQIRVHNDAGWSSWSHQSPRIGIS